MNGSKDKTVESNENVAETTKVSASRRKFAKAGLITPVIMSLSSQPALAACSRSGIMSGNLSGPSEEICVPALSAAYWDANRDQWEGMAGESVNGVFDLELYFMDESNTFVDIYDRTAVRHYATGADNCAGSDQFQSKLEILLYQAIAALINVETFGESDYTFSAGSIISGVSAAFRKDRDQGSCLNFPHMSNQIAFLERKNNGNAYP